VFEFWLRKEIKMKDPGAMLNQKQNSMNAAPGSSHFI
jgi:hypothetical protein